MLQQKPRYISIRWKILFIYVVCILVPIGLVTGFFYNGLLKSVEDDQRNMLNQRVHRAALDVSEHIQNAVLLSDKLYADSAFYEALDHTYLDFEEFNKVFELYIKIAWNKVSNYNPDINSMIVYTNNRSLNNNDIIHYIDDDVKSLSWMKDIQESTDNTRLTSSIGKVDYPNGKNLELSLIRKLDYNKNYSYYTKFLKINFIPDVFFRIFRDEALKEGSLFLLDDKGHVVASSSLDIEPQVRAGTQPTLQIGKNQFSIVQEVDASPSWTVVGVFSTDFFTKAFKQTRNRIILVVLLAFAFSIAAISVLTNAMGAKLRILENSMKKIENGDFNPVDNPASVRDELGHLIHVMNQMATRIQEQIVDISQSKVRETSIELEKKQAELNALQSQVDPHFMFNVLETIRMKSYLKGEQETARIIKYMSKLFRKLLEWDNDLIRIREEIEFIQEFLLIQQYRFDDELSFEFSVDESSKNYLIPKMILQTLVENACVHGIESITTPGKIGIRIIHKGDQIHCSISDNGAGLDLQKLEHIRAIIKNPDQPSSSVGIKNVVRRLMLNYGNDFQLTVQSEKNIMTEMKLIFPAQKGKEGI